MKYNKHTYPHKKTHTHIHTKTHTHIHTRTHAFAPKNTQKHTRIHTKSGACIAFSSAWVGEWFADLVNEALKPHEHHKRAGTGTIASISLTLCVMLAAVSAELANGKRTALRIRFSTFCSCALLGCATHLFGVMLYEFMRYFRVKLCKLFVRLCVYVCVYA